MKTIQSTSEDDVVKVLGRARTAILEGGFDDLVTVAEELQGLLEKQNPPLKISSLSPLVKPLIAIADILATDKIFLGTALAAYLDAAHFSQGKDDDLNKQAVIAVLKKAERLPSSAERIETYQLAMQEAPSPSSIATLAKHKIKEQENPVYFRMRPPRELPRLEEAVIESDLKTVFADAIKRVIRQQAPSGEIQYSVVVPRGFSRGKLAQAGVQSAQKLRRVSADDDLDRIVVPANLLPPNSLRDIDFLSRLLGYGIYIDANHGRTRDPSGAVNGYKFPEGSNPDRLRYIGIDTRTIIPQEGKIFIPLENINFYADPALIGKWSWISAAGGNLKTSVPEDERSMVIQSLQTYGITPSENKAGAENIDYIVVARADKARLNSIVHQHVLHERNKQLLSFAESLPGFAGNIALAAYQDACGTFYGLKNRR